PAHPGGAQGRHVVAHHGGRLGRRQGPAVGRDGDDFGAAGGRIGQGLSGPAHRQLRRPAGAHELHGGVARTGQVVGDDGDERGHAQTLAWAGCSPPSSGTATSSAGLSSPARFRKYEANTGARIELISTHAATCAVAVLTYCWKVGSAAATTAGVAMALPAVVPAAKPMPLLPPRRRM